VGVAYAAGGLSLGLRLWYLQDPWTPVLGQLPRDFILFNAFGQVILPAVIIGAIGYLLFERFGLGFRQLRTPRIMFLLMAGWTAALAFIPLITLNLASRRVLPGVVRPYWQIFLASWVLDLIWLVFLYALVRTSKTKMAESGQQPQQLPAQATTPTKRLMGMGVATLALIPFVASVSASFPLPTVILCGPEFSHIDASGRDYAIGNLIGTSGQLVYVAETRYRSRLTPQHIISTGRYIAIIPLSYVRLETIGQNPECNDLRPAQAQESPSPGTTLPAK
jgi:hypothetical protein